MTEAEWLECGYAPDMLKFLGDRASGRKLRLFACACCQRIWPSITDKRSRAAILAAEQYAEGVLPVEELEAACEAAHEYAEELHAATFAADRADAIANGYMSETDEPFGSWEIASVVSAPAQAASYAAYRENLPWASGQVAEEVAVTVGNYDPQRYDAGVQEERRKLAALLRDIFGNPFRPVAFNPAWRTDTAVALAEGMYAARDFGAMPILADALQDAGCDNEDVLNHCRDANATHTRGCWVVDLVLGKE